MWNTLTAGLQKFQEKLDTVLDDSQVDTEKGPEDTDGAVVQSSSDAPVPPAVTVTAQPPSPAKIEQSDPNVRVASLQQALDQAEEQTALINSEYRKLLASKEEEIASLKAQVASRQETSAGPPSGSGDHTSSLEIVQKELAAHKEMVTELRNQLEGKEEELQELNAKAETKFKKLRAQAKNKIAELNREMERLREGKASGSDTLNISALNTSSLDDSVVLSSPSSTASGDHAHREAESLRTQLAEKEQEVCQVKEEVCRAQKESEELKTEMAALKDKLNVSEVCLQKEQENRVSMELQITRVEEHLDQVTSELTQAREDKLKLSEELDRCKNQSKDLDEGLYPTESEGGRSEQLSGEGPLPTSSPSVLAAGERGSLVDLESEIATLESTIRERDQQLSSFKTVLEEKESALEKQLQKEEELTTQLEATKQETNSLQAAKDSDIEKLQSDLSMSRQGTLNAEEEVNRLQSCVEELETEAKKLKEVVEERDSSLAQLTSKCQDVKTSHEKLVQELSQKCEEVRILSESVDSQRQTIAEKDAKISDGVSHVSALEQSLREVQLTNESLRANMDSSREETVGKVAEYSSKVVMLDQTVSDLRGELEESRCERERLTSAARQLEEQLSAARESTQQRENTAGKEIEELRSSLSQRLVERENELQEKLALRDKELQVVLMERDSLKDELTLDKDRSKQALEQLQSEKDTISNQFSECQVQVTKTSGALEFAQTELAGKDGTIKNLSGALEEKKAALVAMESEMARLKSEQADKLTEVMQRSEQNVRNRGVVEAELRDARTQLEAKEKDLKLVQTELDVALREKDGIKTDLEVALSKFETLQREREASRIESETLRGEVESLSETRTSLSQEREKQQESLSELKSKLAQSSNQVQGLQKKLEVAASKLRKAVEEREKLEGDLDRQQKESQQTLEKAMSVRDEEIQKRVEVEGELSRHKKENQQMKQQFDSAVQLMETKLSNQTTAMGRMNIDLNQKDSELASLRDQLGSESRTSSELRERNSKLMTDCKVSSEQCRLLESEKADLQQALAQLRSQHGHLEHTLADALSEKEALQQEHRASLERVQQHEARVLDLTDQLGKLAREKHTLEGQLHEVSRQLLSSEQSKLSVMGEVGDLREAVQSAGTWDKERKAVLEEKSVLESEKVSLLAEGANLRAQLAVLEREKSVLQTEATGLREEVTSLHQHSQQAVPNYPGSAQSEDFQKQIAELKQTHASELTHLHHAHSSELSSVQRALQEERSKREAAESAQRDVAISMEDVQPLASTGEATPTTVVDYMNVASAWIQRLIKNPNIVLTRLLRATHQTKLFFLSYFLLLHLLLLYLIIT